MPPSSLWLPFVGLTLGAATTVRLGGGGGGGSSSLPLLTLDVDKAGCNYSVSLDGALWLESSPPSLVSGGERYVAAEPAAGERQLHLLQGPPAAAVNGTEPDLGPFEALSCSWALEAGGAAALVTTFKVLLAPSPHNAVIFEQSFPGGIAGAVLGGGDGSGGGSGNTKKAVSTEFPAFRMADAPGGPKLHGWAGRNQAVSTGAWGQGSSLGDGGVNGGSPLLLFAGRGGAMRSAVLSPLTNLMASGAALPTRGTKGAAAVGALGVLGSVVHYPAGFTHQAVLTAGGRPSAAILEWGDVLLARGGKRRTALPHPTDLSLNTLGYWTDNGAWYVTFHLMTSIFSSSTDSLAPPLLIFTRSSTCCKPGTTTSARSAARDRACRRRARARPSARPASP